MKNGRKVFTLVCGKDASNGAYLRDMDHTILNNCSGKTIFILK